jgi:hypothetical protein
MKPRTAAIALLAALAATTAAAQQKPGMTLETSKALSWLKDINTQADVDRLNLPQLPESVTKNIKPLVVDRRLRSAVQRQQADGNARPDASGGN